MNSTKAMERTGVFGVADLLQICSAITFALADFPVMTCPVRTKIGSTRLASARRGALVLAVFSALLLIAAQPADAQTETPAVAHNTWTSGVAMPTALLAPQVAVLGKEIYVVGGDPNDVGYSADTQIYEPASDTWSAGVPLPIATGQGGAAVVKNILYVIGGSTSSQQATDAVWAYSSKTKAWTAKAPMPTARFWLDVVVEKNIIYAIGGVNVDGGVIDTVESYNPETDTWTEEAPLLVAKEGVSAALIGTTIVSADGYTDEVTGDNEGYDAATNAWKSLKSDPTARSYACARSIGSQLYAAGGWNVGGAALSTTESFKPSKQTWTTLASMPQATIAPGSAVYKGQLYCFGGWASYGGSVLENVQIYQP